MKKKAKKAVPWSRFLTPEMHAALTAAVPFIARAVGEVVSDRWALERMRAQKDLNVSEALLALATAHLGVARPLSFGEFKLRNKPK